MTRTGHYLLKEQGEPRRLAAAAGGPGSCRQPPPKAGGASARNTLWPMPARRLFPKTSKALDFQHARRFADRSEVEEEEDKAEDSHHAEDVGQADLGIARHEASDHEASKGKDGRDQE